MIFLVIKKGLNMKKKQNKTKQNNYWPNTAFNLLNFNFNSRCYNLP